MKRKVAILLFATITLFGCVLSDIWAGTVERSQKDANRFATSEAVYCGPYGPGWCKATPTPEP